MSTMFHVFCALISFLFIYCIVKVFSKKAIAPLISLYCMNLLCYMRSTQKKLREVRKRNTYTYCTVV